MYTPSRFAQTILGFGLTLFAGTAMADVRSTVSISDLSLQLIDLRPDDGISASGVLNNWAGRTNAYYSMVPSVGGLSASGVFTGLAQTPKRILVEDADLMAAVDMPGPVNTISSTAVGNSTDLKMPYWAVYGDEIRADYTGTMYFTVGAHSSLTVSYRGVAEIERIGDESANLDAWAQLYSSSTAGSSSAIQLHLTGDDDPFLRTERIYSYTFVNDTDFASAERVGYSAYSYVRMLLPIPEPSQSALLVAGLALLLVVRRRRNF